MKPSRQIRIALLTSILSLALCIAVLVGTTLAWFSDSVSSTENAVRTGQIDASFSLQRDGQTCPLTPGETNPAAALTTTNWAPGMEETVTFQVERTASSLPFTYSIWLKSSAPDAKLARYLEVSVNDSAGPAGTVAELINTPVVTGTLQEDTQTNPQTIRLTIRMKSAPLSLAGQMGSLPLWFEVRADQLRAAAASPDALQEQLDAGGYVQLGDNLQITPAAPEDVKEGEVVPQVAVTQDAMLDLSDKTLGIAAEAGTSIPCTPALISVGKGSTLTVDGTGTVSAEAGTNNSCAIHVAEGSTLILNGGTYLGAMSAVQVQSGRAIIHGGFFDLAPTWKTQAPDKAAYLIDCQDEAYRKGEASVEILGGTFVNFDPSHGPEGDSYLAEGYRVEARQQANGDIWYTVVPEENGGSNG